MSVDDIGFIIPSYCDTKEHINSLQKCVKSIRTLYATIKIVIIDSFSPISIDLFNDDNNIIIQKSEYEGAGLILPYYYFYSKKYFTKAIIMHDSVTINNIIDDIDCINTIKYLKHFTNHILHWAGIIEPETEFTLEHNIKNHDDLNMYMVNTYMNNKEFVKYFNSIYYHKSKWIGCFGAMSIITIDFMKELQDKTGILDLVCHMKDRRHKRAFESIFSIACQYTLNKIPDSYSLYYDGINTSTPCDKYFSKEFFDR